MDRNISERNPQIPNVLLLGNGINRAFGASSCYRLYYYLQGGMNMTCPRCGEPMSGGVCNICGFPVTKRRKKAVKNKRFIYIKRFA